MKRLLTLMLCLALSFNLILIVSADNTPAFFENFENGMKNWTVENGSGFSINNKSELAFDNMSVQIEPSVITAGDEWTDYEAETKITPKDGSYLGIFVRYINSDTNYLVRFYLTEGMVRLLKKVNGGSYNCIASAESNISYGNTYDIKVNIVSNTITLTINGEEIITANDTAIEKGKIGFLGLSSKFSIDKVVVNTFDAKQSSDKNKDIFNFGLQTSYSPIKGKTVMERFNERVDELPDEIPVISPFEVKGKTEYFVSTSGSDNSDGSREKPFKTIKRALQVVEYLEDKSAGVVVYLREGTYSVDDPVTLNSKISGSKDFPLFISAYNGENVSIVGGTSIPSEAFTPVSDSEVLKRLYPKAQSHVLEADLKKLGIEEYGSIIAGTTIDTSIRPSLYINGKEMTIARYPNINEVVVGEVIDVGPVTTMGSEFYTNGVNDGRGFEFILSDPKPLQWENTGDLWMRGSFYAEWDKNYYQIRKINPKTNSIRTVNNSLYGAVTKPTNKHYYFNVFEELDMPGEWFLNKKTGKLYVYPAGDISGANIVMVNSKKNILQVSDANDIVINNITFEAALGNAVLMNNCKRVVVQNCVLQDVGGYGARIVNCYQSGVINSVVQRIGSDGISISLTTTDKFIDMQKLLPQRNFVQNCYIYDSLRGIVIEIGVGNIVSHNLVEHTKNNGIMVSYANESIVEYNEINGAPYEYIDAGSVYLMGHGSVRGNHIRYNYIHDSTLTGDKTTCIYLDNMSSDNYAYGNILIGSLKGMFTHNGKEDVFYNNILSKNAKVSIGDSLNFYDKNIFQYLWVSILKQNDFGSYMQMDKFTYINPYKSIWSARYPTFADYHTKLLKNKEEFFRPGYVRNKLEDDLRSPTNNVYANNLLFNTIPISISSIGMQTAVGVETNYSTDTDPGFADVNNNNYNLKPDALVFEKIPGFIAPSFDKMGITGELPRNKDKTISTIDCIAPGDGSKGEAINENVLFGWAEVSGANYYTLTVADDNEFKNVIGEYKTANANYSLVLDGMGKEYFWKVNAVKLAKSLPQTTVASSVKSFTTMTEDELNIYGNPELGNLIINIRNANKFLGSMVEGGGKGQYKEGAIQKLKDAISQAEISLKKDKVQSKVDKTGTILKSEIEYAKKQINANYKNLENFDLSKWKVDSSKIDLAVSKDGELVCSPKVSSSMYLDEVLLPKETLTFSMNIQALNNWMGIGLRQTNKFSAPASLSTTNNYFIVIKPDAIELQKYNNNLNKGITTNTDSIVQSVVNNQIIKSNVWYNITVGAVTTDNGVLITLIIDGKKIIEYLDSDDPIYDDGYFTVQCNYDNNTVKFRKSNIESTAISTHPADSDDN